MAIQVVACLTLNPDEPEAIQTYFDTAMPLIESVGAVIRQRFDIGEAIIGERIAETMMVVEYPDHDALESVFESDDYKAIIPARDKAFLKYSVNVLSG